jgi:methylase of polypeptide subunit release factors
MRRFVKTLEHQVFKPWLRRVRPYSQVTYSGLAVSYKPHLDGGGSTFGQDIIPLLRARGMPKVKRAFEWCAGPGFIGFSLLAHNLAETLCLADVNPEAVAACRRTIARNGLEARASVYLSNNLKGLPESEQWDLVVGNPPHFAKSAIGQKRYHDADWEIHREFFSDVSNHLRPGGFILLQENTLEATPDTFAAMIAEAGLTLVFVREPSEDHPRIFYLGIKRTRDTTPAWASA